jgi:hypothetical protein
MNMIGLWLAFAVILAAMAGLVIFAVIRFLTLCSRLWIRQGFVNGTAVPRPSSEDTGEWDLYRQAQSEQEWLFSQMLMQGQDETANQDASDLSMDW